LYSWRAGSAQPRGPRQEGGAAITTLIAYHEVNDSEHWLASTKREELFGPLGISFRTFLDPENPTRAALLIDVPDMAAFQAFMQSDAAAEAMAHDGVRADTLVTLVEA
jgi:hypothetical protein